MPRPRAAFMGTPDFAVPTLRALLEVADVPLVVCQPDRPKGRGMKLAPPPTKVLALEHGVPVIQPRRVRDGRLAQGLRELELDVAVVIAYGRILPKDVLEAPRLGCVNLHASLLPRWRGAAPIQWAVVSGDHETGVCLMQMDEGMDTGDVLSRAGTPIDRDETSGQLAERLSSMAAALVREQLPRYVAGELSPERQPEAGVTHARMLEKDDGRLDFARPARAVHDRVRGLSPWPGTFTLFQGRRLKVHRTRVLEPASASQAAPGTVLEAGAEGIVVACGEGRVALLEVQLDGKRRTPAGAFVAGHALAPGERFSEPRAGVVGAS